jgi:hypothetical protein
MEMEIGNEKQIYNEKQIDNERGQTIKSRQTMLWR